MSEEIKDFNDQLVTIIEEIRKLVDQDIPKLKGKAKVEKCEHAKSRLNRAKQLLKSYNVELRELSRADAKPYEDKGKEHDSTIQKLSDNLTFMATAAERDDLFQNKGRNADEMTAKDLVVHAKTIQDQSKASTTRTKDVLQHTIEIGTNTSEALKKQTEQLQNVDQNLDAIESNLVRADKQIRIFLRRMAADKVVVSMVVLVLLAILATIIVVIVTKQKPTVEDLREGNFRINTNLPNITLPEF
ncbi:hypothetical protein MP638_005046 [Amoeboaphelidium occidentale]|nr:hypothetical protein MP638_005046 [Amoeboaphelidium occidentale]